MDPLDVRCCVAVYIIVCYVSVGGRRFPSRPADVVISPESARPPSALNQLSGHLFATASTEASSATSATAAVGTVTVPSAHVEIRPLEDSPPQRRSPRSHSPSDQQPAVNRAANNLLAVEADVIVAPPTSPIKVMQNLHLAAKKLESLSADLVGRRWADKAPQELNYIDDDDVTEPDNNKMDSAVNHNARAVYCSEERRSQTPPELQQHPSPHTACSRLVTTFSPCGANGLESSLLVAHSVHMPRPALEPQQRLVLAQIGSQQSSMDSVPGSPVLRPHIEQHTTPTLLVTSASPSSMIARRSSLDVHRERTKNSEPSGGDVTRGRRAVPGRAQSTSLPTSPVRNCQLAVVPQSKESLVSSIKRRLSPLSAKRRFKHRPVDSSDDESSAGYSDQECVCTSENYQNLETFQKAQFNKKVI